MVARCAPSDDLTHGLSQYFFASFHGELDPLRDVVRIKLFLGDSRALVRDPTARTRRDVGDVSIFAAEEFVSVSLNLHVDVTVAACPIERAALYFCF